LPACLACLLLPACLLACLYVLCFVCLLYVRCVVMCMCLCDGPMLVLGPPWPSARLELPCACSCLHSRFHCASTLFVTQPMYFLSSLAPYVHRDPYLRHTSPTRANPSNTKEMMHIKHKY
jgi:hypothetical protein